MRYYCTWGSETTRNQVFPFYSLDLSRTDGGDLLRKCLLFYSDFLLILAQSVWILRLQQKIFFPLLYVGHSYITFFPFSSSFYSLQDSYETVVFTLIFFILIRKSNWNSNSFGWCLWWWKLHNTISFLVESPYKKWARTPESLSQYQYYKAIKLREQVV